MSNYKEEADFKTLSTAATTFIYVGWGIVIICVIVALGSLAENSRAYGGPELQFIIYIAGGILGALSGVFFVGIGQLLRCFLGVYSNTKETNRILEDRLAEPADS